MNISNAVYTFINSAVISAESDDVFYGTDVQSNLYESIKEKKTIRVGDVQQSKPTLELNKVAERNAFLTVQIIVRPESQILPDRLAARDAATSIALKIAKMVFDDERLGGNVCDCGIEALRMDWANINTLRHATAFLLLKVDGKGI